MGIILRTQVLTLKGHYRAHTGCAAAADGIAAPIFAAQPIGPSAGLASATAALAFALPDLLVFDQPKLQKYC